MVIVNIPYAERPRFAPAKTAWRTRREMVLIRLMTGRISLDSKSRCADKHQSIKTVSRHDFAEYSAIAEIKKRMVK